MIELIECTKSYTNDRIILDKVSLKIPNNSFIAFTGESGAGKSTLMNIIGTIDKMNSGVLTFNGENISKFNNKKLSKFRNENIGFIFQSFCLLPDFTVYENMEIPLLYSKKDIKDRQVLIETTLKKFNILELIDKKAVNLSGGEKQRVAIAKAMVNNPSFIIADEPTGNLDVKNRKIVMEELVGINKSGVSVLIVTHDLKVAEYCNSIYEIKDKNIHLIK